MERLAVEFNTRPDGLLASVIGSSQLSVEASPGTPFASQSGCSACPPHQTHKSPAAHRATGLLVFHELQNHFTWISTFSSISVSLVWPLCEPAASSFFNTSKPSSVSP